MRPAALTLLLVAFSLAATSQLTFLPQLGFENSRTRLSYNDLSSFLPMGNQLAPRLSLRVDYKFKQGHGPFVGVSTNQSSLYYTFTDPENGMNAYTAMRGNLQLQLEGGYQISTNRLYLSKSGNSKSSKSNIQRKKSSVEKIQINSAKKDFRSYSYKSGCGERVAKSPSVEKSKQTQSVATNRCGEKSYKTQSVATNRCGEKSSKTQSTLAKPNSEKFNKVQQVVSKANRWFVRIQPSAGLAFIPSPEGNISIKEAPAQNYTIYQYKAGNWSSAIVTGAAFEFGQNVQRKFTVSVNYLKGLGNLDSRTITTMNGIKPNITTLRSQVSSWSLAVGIPLSVTKKSSINKKSDKKNWEQRCGGKYKIYKTKTIVL